MADPSATDLNLYSYSIGRLLGLRVNRYTWWVHWRELADYFLPRRYKWIITPNMMARGAPINQHILDSSGFIFAQRSLPALSRANPAHQAVVPHQVGRLDSTKTSPLPLARRVRTPHVPDLRRVQLLQLHRHFYLDLVVFGTASMLIYEDFNNVINCINPCLGEYYVDIDGKYRPCIFYREFTMTVDACVSEFGIDNCLRPNQGVCSKTAPAPVAPANSSSPTPSSPTTTATRPSSASRQVRLSRSYWEWGGSTSPQGGATPLQASSASQATTNASPSPVAGTSSPTTPTAAAPPWTACPTKSKSNSKPGAKPKPSTRWSTRPWSPTSNSKTNPPT